MKTKPNEFKKFHVALTRYAPGGYVPWYFPVVKHNKAPDGIAISKLAPKNCEGKPGNWKADWARLSFDGALKRIKSGKNVGIAARSNDPLIIIDIDEYDYLKYMPCTLICTSRKRSGQHGFCWKKQKENKINIPTDYGEVRSSDQYVVAAGSFCDTSENDIDKENIPQQLKNKIKKDIFLGCYTVKQSISPKIISFSELPYFFLAQHKKVRDKPIIKTQPISLNKKHSALFDLRIEDIVHSKRNSREPHPLHSSDTGMNFSMADGLAHCWRHSVSLNALQFLVVKSGYMSCLDAGTGHKASGAGSSSVTGDDGAIFYAWLEAKKCNLIPKDDPVPVKAIHYIAKKHHLIDEIVGYKLPKKIYNLVLTIVEVEY